MKKDYHRLTEEHRKILMKNPLYENLIVEFRDGWYNLIDELGQRIYRLCNMTNQPLPRILQVKEKFGSLRYYYNASEITDATVLECIKSLVRQAEKRSENICEKCGSKYASLMCDGGRWETVCKEHTADGSLTVDEYKYLLSKRSKEK